MFEPIFEDSFDMNFTVLVDDASLWPQISYARVISRSHLSQAWFDQNHVGEMDVLIDYSSKLNTDTIWLEKLKQLHRLAFHFQVDSSDLNTAQAVIRDLCAASVDSHNFDILDANCFLSCGGDIALFNSQVASPIEKMDQVQAAVMILCNVPSLSDQTVTPYIQQAEKIVGVGQVACIGYLYNDSDIESFSLLIQLGPRL